MIEFELSKELLLDIIAIAKNLKSTYTVCENTPYGVYVYGFGQRFGLMKNITDYSRRLEGKRIPVNIAFVTKDLNEIEKEAKVGNNPIIISAVGCDNFIFSKFITCGTYQIQLVDYSTLSYLGNRISTELIESEILIQKKLTDDPEFLEMELTKTEDGISTLHIGDHLVYVAPNMLNILKDDEVSIDIRTANIGKFIVFNIVKNKKKCTVQVIFRSMDIRR